MDAQEQRRLLELAAKAAGYRLAPMSRKFGHRDEPILLEGVGLVTADGKDWQNWPRFWNPITDDGDALRLAVKLGMDVDVCFPTNSTWAMAGYDDGPGITEHHRERDPYAATRLAIVRAAAAIGEKLEAKP